MKRRPIIIAALAIGTIATVLAFGSAGVVDDAASPTRPVMSLADRALALVGLGPDRATDSYSGYVEAEYVLVASTIGGTLTELRVARGDRVEAGALLFRLDDAAERAARDEAVAKLRQAEATLANLQTGRRPDEIAAIRAQRAQSQAALRASEAEYERQVKLRATGTSSARQLDDARMQRDRDRARLAEAEAQLRVANLPGREAEREAAEAAAVAARAAVAQAEWRLDQKAGRAPAGGTVVDTLYRPGEAVPAGQPVVQLLPPPNLKLRFFVPERVVATLAVGQPVRFACDGCGPPRRATIRYIAPRAEFTPPVIYSREQRARLVFMVEAWPDTDAESLRAGLPVDVTPIAKDPS